MTTYYVDPLSGNDASNGLSVGNAWETIAHAIATAAAGDDIRCMNTAPATPASTLAFASHANTLFQAANSSGDPIESGFVINDSDLTAATNLATIESCEGLRFRGIEFSMSGNAAIGILSILDDSDGVRFQQCRIHGATSHGIDKTSAKNEWIFYNCEIDNNGGLGIRSNDVGPFVLLNCKVHNNSGGGGLCYRGITAVNSQIYRNGGHGLRANNGDLGGAFAFIKNCTFYLNTGSGIFDQRKDGDGAAIFNCSFVGNTEYGLFINDNQPTGFEDPFILSHNHFHNNTTADSNVTLANISYANQSGDPLFASTADGSENFTPGSSSPLISNGIDGGYIGALPAASSGGGGGISQLAGIGGGLITAVR